MHRIFTIVTTSVAVLTGAGLIAFVSINWTVDMLKTLLITFFIVSTLLAAGPPLVAQWTRTLTARDRARERAVDRARVANTHLHALVHRSPQDH